MSLRLRLGGLLRLRVEFLLLVLDSLVKRLHDLSLKLMYFSTIVNAHSEDRASIDETLRENPQDGIREITLGRCDEPCDCKGIAAYEHGEGGPKLNAYFGVSHCSLHLGKYYQAFSFV